MDLLQGMVYQTLVEHRQLLGLGDYNAEAVERGRPRTDFDRVMSWAANPLMPGFEADGLTAVVLTEAGTRLCEFRVGDCVFIYSLGSASRANDDGDNTFVEYLCDRIKELKPERVITATFSRLVRSSDFTSDILVALKTARSTLHLGGGERLNVRKKADEVQFTLFGMWADFERRALVTRMLIGKLNTVRRREWYTRKAALPLGYRLEQGRLTAVPELKPHVMKVIQMLGDEHMTPSDFVLNLEALGLRPPTGADGWSFDREWVPKGSYENRVLRGGSTHAPATRGVVIEPDAETDEDQLPAIEDELETPLVTASGRLDARAVLLRCYRYLDLWEHGTLTIRQKNPVREADNFADAMVHRTDEDPIGYIELTYRGDELAVEGGWADAAMFAAAREGQQRFLDSRRSGGAEFALTGAVSQWTDEHSDYRLTSESETASRPQPAAYVLEVRDAEHQGKPWYAFPGVRNLKVSVHTLHQAMVLAAIEGFRNGLNLEHVETHLARLQRAEWELETERMRHDLERLEAEAVDRADKRDRAEQISDEEERSTQDFAFRRAAREARQLRDDLLVRSETLPVPELGTTVELDTDVMIWGLTALHDADVALPPTVADAIGDLISGFRLRADQTDTVAFEYYLHFPSADSVLRAGPISGSCLRSEARPRGVAARALHNDRRGAEWARRLLGAAEAHDDALPRGSASPHVARATAYLESVGMTRPAARAALSVVPIDTRRLIWALLHGEAVDEDLDPQFASLIEETYLHDAPRYARNGNKWYRGDFMPAAIVEKLRRTGPLPTEEFRQWLGTSGLSLNGYDNLIRRTPRDPQDGPEKYVATGIPLTYAGGNRPTCIGLHDCPHCGATAGMAFYIPVVEVTSDLLCTGCSRGMDPASPVYPASYFDVTRARVEERRRNLDAARRHAPIIMEPSADLRARVKRWNQAQGVLEDVAVNDALLRKYLRAVALGDVDDPPAIREWIRAVGTVAVRDAGPLPREALEAFTKNFSRAARGGQRNG